MDKLDFSTFGSPIFNIVTSHSSKARCQAEVTSDQVQVKRTRSASRPNLQGVEIVSSAHKCDQRSLRSEDGLIRGHFRMAKVLSEVTSRWFRSDQRSLPDGLSDQRPLPDGFCLIRGHFQMVFV